MLIITIWWNKHYTYEVDNWCFGVVYCILSVGTVVGMQQNGVNCVNIN